MMDVHGTMASMACIFMQAIVSRERAHMPLCVRAVAMDPLEWRRGQATAGAWETIHMQMSEWGELRFRSMPRPAHR